MVGWVVEFLEGLRKVKVYFFLDLLKIRYVLPLYQHFIIPNLLGFWMGGLGTIQMLRNQDFDPFRPHPPSL